MKPTLLLILDGWGVAAAGPGNAVSLASMPNINALVAKYPGALLHCSGRNVGLPQGFMGNSEVGHMNIGAGRIVYQDMTRIDLAIEHDELQNNLALQSLLDKTVKSKGRLHFMGLLSDGGVHSHIDHLFALLKICKSKGVPAIVHAFMDGRDTSPTSGVGYVQKLLDYMQEIGWGALGSVCGRYYAMDRDKRWDRVKIAWDALVHGNTHKAGAPATGDNLPKTPVQYLDACYQAGETDEFVKPYLFVEPAKAQTGHGPQIQDGDSIFFFNFRADRARELTRAFIQPDFSEFDRLDPANQLSGAEQVTGVTGGQTLKLAAFVSMTRYEEDFDIPVVFERDSLKNGLGEIISNFGWEQLRIAETEKYAHVTYFFNGGREDPFLGEQRHMIASPKEVATYDLKPEMSAFAVTDLLIDEWNSGRFNFVVCNLANLDMVGHSGNIPATIKACEAVDACVGRIVEAVLASGGRIFLTADHGNAEQLLDAKGEAMTAHTLNQVRFVLIEDNSPYTLKTEGKLGDIAPTILSAWGKVAPAEMTGNNLLQEKK